MNVKECILLTGAGFTRNFGAPLAADVWALIFSHPDVRAQPRIHELLRDQFDFEAVYQEVMTGRFHQNEQAAMAKAVDDAYGYIDSIVQNYSINRITPDIYQIQTFLDAFAGNRERPGFIFTLNQDLFVERHFYGGTRPSLPYIPVNRDWFTPIFSGRSLDLEDQVALPADISPSLSIIGTDPLYYLKLHGSQNWRHASGNHLMVIGKGKDTQIVADKMLSFYADVFKKVLVEGTKRVLCVGYSFSDPHINDMLADAVRAGVEIFILGPGSPERTACHIKLCHRGEELWKGLAGFFPFDLITLFPPDQRRTEEWRFVSYRFFGRTIGQ